MHFVYNLERRAMATLHGDRMILVATPSVASISQPRPRSSVLSWTARSVPFWVELLSLSSAFERFRLG